MPEVEPVWTPDGRGLPDKALPHGPLGVHLRLTSPDGRSARGACGGGLGEWWTGVASEVNCNACLEWVHA